MAKLIIVLLMMATSLSVCCQPVVGKWNGQLKVMGMELNLVFNIQENDTGYTATMDSPDQGVSDIPVTSVSFEKTTLKLSVAGAGVEYEGVLGADSIITGNFKQSGQVFPLNLSRKITEKKEIRRPQHPVKPYPYHSEDISFENKDANIVLAGTLTLPQKNGLFPAVVLISGSGPQTREEEVFGHKPFLVLSDYLTRNGIAVLRFDDRGTGASKGDFQSATSLDFSTDVEAAVKYLQTRKEIDKKKIGLIGHSEGGIIAPMVAVKSDAVAYIVLLAGTGIPGDSLLLLQQELIVRVSGMNDQMREELRSGSRGAFKIIINATDDHQLKTDLTNYIKAITKNNKAFTAPETVSEDDFVKQQVDHLVTPWMQYFIKYDPATALRKVKCPVLALNGDKDLQVPAKENLTAIEKSLKIAGNKKVTIKTLPHLNHLFQESETGSPGEYSSIEQTFSPVALAEILKWIQAQVK